ncbi:hypothetical protein MNBD_GAMMA04-874 [hydrothermal vent metagenome]|uniref:Regulatory protein, RpfE type n=1 Tax=hydrothermal vent metagenome TaxID=652676 RepID=A0A3B0VQ47_9ZZZZ
MSTAVTLSIPELFNPLRIKEANDALSTLKLPALQTLLAKADRFAAQPQSSYALSSYLFHQPKFSKDSSAFAAIMAAAELNDYDRNAYWLRVDPVQMIADRDSLVLIPSNDLAITEEESKALLQAFNNHFEQDRVQLEFASAQHWYLRMALPVDLQTHSIESLAYQPVDGRYPTGNAATYWRKMINETQMLFFTHPVNEARREQCMPEINSIWVWGEGQLTDSSIVERRDAMVWSDNLYLKGLATLAQSQLASSPSCYQAWQDSVNAQQERGGEKISHHMIQLDPLTNALDNMQQSEWIEALKQLETTWFDPLMNALKQGEIDSLLFEFGSASRYHLKPTHLNRFWRFKSTLNNALQK